MTLAKNDRLWPADFRLCTGCRVVLTEANTARPEGPLEADSQPYCDRCCGAVAAYRAKDSGLLYCLDQLCLLEPAARNEILVPVALEALRDADRCVTCHVTLVEAG